MSKQFIISGGPILTMADNVSAEAILISRDRIEMVGSVADCQKAAGTDYTTVDLAGKCLMPGFIDVHTHPMMLGMTHIWVDLSWPKALKCIFSTVKRPF